MLYSISKTLYHIMNKTNKLHRAAESESNYDPELRHFKVTASVEILEFRIVGQL